MKRVKFNFCPPINWTNLQDNILMKRAEILRGVIVSCIGPTKNTTMSVNACSIKIYQSQAVIIIQ